MTRAAFAAGKTSGDLEVEVIHPNELGAALETQWRAMIASNSALHSPFFHPMFSRLWSDGEERSRVCVVRRSGKLIGFLPLDLQCGAGSPVAGRLNDFHGLVRAPDVEFSAAEVLAAAGIHSLRFNHLVREVDGLALHVKEWHDSPYADLQGGFKAFEAVRQAQGMSSFKAIRRKQRKMERELGAVRFAFDSSSRSDLHRMLEWNSDQRRRTRTKDVTLQPTVRHFLDRLLSVSDPSFKGVLSTLHVGERLAAAHFGLRNGGSLHWWITSYDGELAQFSPGMILTLNILEAAEREDVNRVDFGRGDTQHKRTFSSSKDAVGEGWITADSAMGRVHGVALSALDRLRASQLKDPIKRGLRMARARARGA